jgi:FeS assembly protein IscX
VFNRPEESAFSGSLQIPSRFLGRRGGLGMTAIRHPKQETANDATEVETMPGKLTWDDPEGIALQLMELYPDTDPLSVRFTDLHQWVIELPDFGDDAKASNEGKLEAIQMAWLEEWKEQQAS